MSHLFMIYDHLISWRWLLAFSMAILPLHAAEKANVPAYKNKKEGKTTLQRVYELGSATNFALYLSAIENEPDFTAKIDFFLNEPYKGKTIFYQALKKQDIQMVIFLLTLEVGKNKSFLNHHPVSEPTPIALFLNMPDETIAELLKDIEPEACWQELDLPDDVLLRMRMQMFREGGITYFEENDLDEGGQARADAMAQKVRLADHCVNIHNIFLFFPFCA